MKASNKLPQNKIIKKYDYSQSNYGCTTTTNPDPTTTTLTVLTTTHIAKR